MTQDWYDTEFNEISGLISKNTELSLCEFLRIRNYKMRIRNEVPELEIKAKTKDAFAKKNDIQGAINSLLEIKGVKIPIASAILAMKFPKDFAIIDINVIKALNKPEWVKKYKKDVEIYEEYLSIMKERAKEGKKDLRELERELFHEGQKINLKLFLREHGIK